MYNAGKGHDFLAVELVGGHINYVLNLGYGAIMIKDRSPEPLNDNKWHTVQIGRPSKYKHNLLVDHHLASQSSRGEDVHLDLDGILFLGDFHEFDIFHQNPILYWAFFWIHFLFPSGGVRLNMYGKLPRQIVSRFGYQGCLASLDLNGEAADPINNALVPSDFVNEGCEGRLFWN